jgi:hypothetical protein
MKMRNPIRKGLRFLWIALLLIEWLHGIPSFAVSHDYQPHLSSGFLLDNLPVLSDFDGDNKIDQATLSSRGSLKRIHVVLGKSSSASSLSFESNESDRGRLISGDIDEDGHIDLVWLSRTSGNFVAWLGDGRGHFTGGKDLRLNLDRMHGLLGDGAPRLDDVSNAAELAAVLLGTSFVLPGINRYHPYLAAQGSLVATETLDICSVRFAVLKQRGPPSKLF